MSTSPKFQAGDRLQHLKTGGFYRVLCLAKIEVSLEEAYVYEALINGSHWIRPQIKMEDGRFIKVN